MTQLQSSSWTRWNPEVDGARATAMDMTQAPAYHCLPSRAESEPLRSGERRVGHRVTASKPEPSAAIWGLLPSLWPPEDHSLVILSFSAQSLDTFFPAEGTHPALPVRLPSAALRFPTPPLPVQLCVHLSALSLPSPSLTVCLSISVSLPLLPPSLPLVLSPSLCLFLALSACVSRAGL